ncbi:MAG: exodeoxyribonuclease VII large subunit, partial [Candidatus Polarisedimenticolia bacterium]
MTRGAGRGLFDDPRGDAGEEPSAAPGARGAPLTVRQLNQQCDAALGDGVGAVWVAGELSRFLAHGSGHWYFTLK